MYFNGNVIYITGDCFKVIYFMTINSSSSTFKRNIFLTKSLANAPLTIFIAYNYRNHLYWCNPTYQIKELQKQIPFLIWYFHFMVIDHGSWYMRIKTANNVYVCQCMYCNTYLDDVSSRTILSSWYFNVKALYKLHFRFSVENGLNIKKNFM